VSDQGDPGAVHHGAIGSGDGVDYGQYGDASSVPAPGYSEPPEWLAPIEARMAELADQNYALAEQLQQQQGYGYANDYDDDYDDDEIEDDESDGDQADVLDERFEDLRDAYPMLQDPELCYAVVKRAQALAENMSPGIIESSAFIDLLEATAKSMMVEWANAADQEEAQERARARQPTVQLEAGAGATAHDGRQPEVNFQQLVVDAAARLHPRI
jgi:hypothetical protein